MLNGPLDPILGLREPVSGLAHLISAFAALYGATLLVRSTSDQRKQAVFAIYGASLFALFAASASYHLVSASPGTLAYLRRMDHAAIFLLIAGTYTPFL